MISYVFNELDAEQIENVTLGAFRVPKGYFKQMKQLYPEEVLFNIGLQSKGAQVSYSSEIIAKTTAEITELCLAHLPEQKLFLQGWSTKRH